VQNGSRPFQEGAALRTKSFNLTASVRVIGIAVRAAGYFLHGDRRFTMPFVTRIIATLVLAMPLLQAPSDSAVAATNCGFLTLEQCRASVSGVGGFCVPNPFYNPKRSAKDARKGQTARAERYDPYPWCADYSEGEK
jgi:hypothetical protein